MCFEGTDLHWLPLDGSYTINMMMLVLIYTYIVRTENKKVIILTTTSVITDLFGAIWEKDALFWESLIYGVASNGDICIASMQLRYNIWPHHV